MSGYHQKYTKYKNKYLNLKKGQTGGAIPHIRRDNYYIKGNCPGRAKNEYSTLNEALEEAVRQNCGGVTEKGMSYFQVRGPGRSTNGGPSRHNETSYIIDYNAIREESSGTTEPTVVAQHRPKLPEVKHQKGSEGKKEALDFDQNFDETIRKKSSTPLYKLRVTEKELKRVNNELRKLTPDTPQELTTKYIRGKGNIEDLKNAVKKANYLEYQQELLEEIQKEIQKIIPCSVFVSFETDNNVDSGDAEDAVREAVGEVGRPLPAIPLFDHPRTDRWAQGLGVALERGLPRLPGHDEAYGSRAIGWSRERTLLPWCRVDLPL